MMRGEGDKKIVLSWNEITGRKMGTFIVFLSFSVLEFMESVQGRSESSQLLKTTDNFDGEIRIDSNLVHRFDPRVSF